MQQQERRRGQEDTPSFGFLWSMLNNTPRDFQSVVCTLTWSVWKEGRWAHKMSHCENRDTLRVFYSPFFSLSLHPVTNRTTLIFHFSNTIFTRQLRESKKCMPGKLICVNTQRQTYVRVLHGFWKWEAAVSPEYPNSQEAAAAAAFGKSSAD